MHRKSFKLFAQAFKYTGKALRGSHKSSNTPKRFTHHSIFSRTRVILVVCSFKSHVFDQICFLMHPKALRTYVARLSVRGHSKKWKTMRNMKLNKTLARKRDIVIGCAFKSHAFDKIYFQTNASKTHYALCSAERSETLKTMKTHAKH